MKLKTNEITYLAKSFKQANGLSPFYTIKDEIDGTENQTLVDKKVIVNNGYSPAAKAMLPTLIAPDSCARLIIQMPTFVIEKYVYEMNGKLVLASNDEGELSFTEIEDNYDFIYVLNDLFSDSFVRRSEVDIELARDPFFVLLAIFDVYRRNNLLDYLGTSEVDFNFTVDDIKKVLNKTYPNSLAESVAANYGVELAGIQNVEAALKKLLEHNCITGDNTYNLAPKYEIIAENFLIIESIILLELYEFTNGDDLIADNAMFYIAGVHDILSFRGDGKRFNLQSISANTMIRVIVNSMNEPSLLEEDRPPAFDMSDQAADIPAAPAFDMSDQTESKTVAQIASQTPAISKFCTKCGSPRKQNTKFCTSCGAKFN